LLDTLQKADATRKLIKDSEIDELMQKEGNKRQLVLLRIMGSIALTIGVLGTLAASIAFPILPAVVTLNILLAGAAMVSTYVVTNFGWDTIKSLRKIKQQYSYEKEQIFTLWCDDNPTMTKSIFNPRYLNARMQLIHLPATAHAFVDLISNLKTALSESVEEFLELPGMGPISRLTNLFHKVQSGWVKTFGKPKKLAEFQEKEKIFSALLARRRCGSFEEAVLEMMEGPPPISNKEEARSQLLKIIKEEIAEFKAKYPNQDDQERELKNMARRFAGYQRAVENETRKLLKENPVQTEKTARAEAVNAINKRHPLENKDTDHFMDEQLELIALDSESNNPRDDRVWIPLKTLGNLGLAIGIILGLLSFAIPGLPVLAAPLLMGISATMILIYIGANFRYDIFEAISKASKKHREENVPYFDIWVKVRKRPKDGIRHFFTRLLCTVILSAKEAIEEINKKLDSSISGIIKEGRHISEKTISEKTKTLYKEFRSLNRFETLVDELTIDLVPTDFRETAELIDLILKSKGYENFEDAVTKQSTKEQPDPGQARERLSDELCKDIKDFNQSFTTLVNVDHLSEFEARKTLLLHYYNAYKTREEENAKIEQNKLAYAVLKEMGDKIDHDVPTGSP
jgi:hypothetical protein